MRLPERRFGQRSSINDLGISSVDVHPWPRDNCHGLWPRDNCHGDLTFIPPPRLFRRQVDRTPAISEESGGSVVQEPNDLRVAEEMKLAAANCRCPPLQSVERGREGKGRPTRPRLPRLTGHLRQQKTPLPNPGRGALLCQTVSRVRVLPLKVRSSAEALFPTTAPLAVTVIPSGMVMGVHGEIVSAWTSL